MFSDNNLFNTQWTTGNLSAIAPIVQIVGFIAMCLISIGGFFMVILPLMRNVINGIVVVAPNLCDKIDEAHRNKLGLNHVEGGNQVQMVVGSLTMIILSFFPNFKAMSDFDQGIRDPKSFMIKAIPMMCIYIFIGVFIFYGYPARIADKFSVAATGFIDMALNNVDPVAWIEKIPTNLARPDLSTSNATDELGKNTNTLSKSIYSSLTSKYNAMSRENRIAVSHEIESWTNSKLAEISQYSDSNKFKMTVETRVTSYDPQLNERAVWPTPAHDTNENIFVFQTKEVISNIFNIGVPGGTEGDYLMCVIKFYELAEKGDTASNVRNNATFRSSDLRGGNNNTVVWTVPDGFAFSRGSIKLNGITGTLATESVGQSGVSYKITFPVSSSELQNASGESTGIFVVDPNNPGYQHAVVKVTWGTEYRFNPIEANKFNSWGLGQSPTLKSSTSN